MYATPETGDGWITRIESRDDSGFTVSARFTLSQGFRRLVGGRESDLVFAARSRLARLGINILPLGAPDLNGQSCDMRLRIVAAIASYGIGAHLECILVPGLRIGRLVFCPTDTRLGSSDIHRLIRDNRLQVPEGFSLDGNGYLILRPQRQIFRFQKPLTTEEVTAIATHADGKDLLNRLQVREEVDHIELPPRDGLVTACSMFLHSHYVVLRNLDESLGFHLQATVLDPVTTRGTNVYLEFINRTEQLIINPSIAASVHEAIRVDPRPRYWHGHEIVEPSPQEAGGPDACRALTEVFDRLEAAPVRDRYSHRMIAVSQNPHALLAGAAPDRIWTQPLSPHDPRVGTDLSAGLVAEGLQLDIPVECGTQILDNLPDGARATLLLGYFPNLIEHTQICAAALRQRVGRIVFRRASFEHGPFLSSRDHGRLADYEGLGLEVFWCNETRGQVVRHVFRGMRGYFTTPDKVDRFGASLIFAIYGSTKPLSERSAHQTERLLKNLCGLFGSDIGILTGGGPGAMQQVTDIAQGMGLMAGSSFIETIDQELNQTAEFYQTFQARSRQARQRWFEIASFHLFLIGGVGTLEEVGLTLTDMKLGVIERSPIVFFDGSGNGFYWEGLREQLAEMARQGRVPAWLIDQVLMTTDPDAVPNFYKQKLRLG
ncbi:LOG family protein [Thiorhodococcus fuscus]|uniref:AMP nucleosidase n=1 Tax=Thiorhodococcus fuscus TaxID=527200 RepID=A0ABW4Y7L4_9GAMM